jgi:hypothetical protein
LHNPVSGCLAGTGTSPLGSRRWPTRPRYAESVTGPNSKTCVVWRIVRSGWLPFGHRIRSRRIGSPAPHGGPAVLAGPQQGQPVRSRAMRKGRSTILAKMGTLQGTTEQARPGQYRPGVGVRAHLQNGSWKPIRSTRRNSRERQVRSGRQDFHLWRRSGLRLWILLPSRIGRRTETLQRPPIEASEAGNAARPNESPEDLPARP